MLLWLQACQHPVQNYPTLSGHAPDCLSCIWDNSPFSQSPSLVPRLSCVGLGTRLTITSHSWWVWVWAKTLFYITSRPAFDEDFSNCSMITHSSWLIRTVPEFLRNKATLLIRCVVSCLSVLDIWRGCYVAQNTCQICTKVFNHYSAVNISNPKHWQPLQR